MRLRGPAAIALLTLAYVVLAGAAVHSDRMLHDEGLLTHLLASLVGRAPAATIFLQKARPPLALLHAPVAALGLGPFLWVHVLVCATAVGLVASTARRLGHARPEIAAAVVALSPMYVAAGAAGLMNADAVVGMALVAWLWAGGRTLAAGLCMGALVWVRAELAVPALVMAALAIGRRQPRMLAGLAGFPLAYGLAGAVYHRDALWMLHFPPALAEPMPDNPFWQAHHAQASLPPVVAALLALTPAVAVLGAWRGSRATTIERAGLAWCGLLFAALVLLPRWQVFNFDLSPRYLLPLLPMLALAVGRVVDDLGPEADSAPGLRRALGLAVFAGLAVATERLGGGAAALGVGLVASAVMALAGAGWLRASWVVLGALLAVGPLALTDGARIARHQLAPALDEMCARLAEHPEWASRPIYTNEPLLAAFLERSGGLPGRDVRYLVQADQLHELSSLSNPASGQRQALLQALRGGFYGTPVFPDELVPERVAPGAVFVLRDDPRLSLVMPPQSWAGLVRVVHPGLGMTIAVRVDPEASR
ncbi:MAG: hypothetical protein KDK70_01915 [Myxococcales bacterium]|nr:hypothetical protein [Myxococcales bacterium]